MSMPFRNLSLQEFIVRFINTGYNPGYNQTYMPSVRRALLCVLLSCGALMLPTAALAQSSDQLPSAPSAVLEEKQQQQKPPAPPPPPQSKPATPAATSSPSTPVTASQKADPPAQDQKAESLVAPTNPTPDSKATSPDTGSSDRKSTR